MNHWATRQNIPNNILSDIYDGQIWKTFKDQNNNQFFNINTIEGRLGLALNVDWFGPTKHTVYSVGAIYLTILNFPRHLRFKKENTLLVGIIPGPQEPSVEEIQGYLIPMVDELLQLWMGQIFITPQYPIGKKFQAALILISCDTPATRKVSICFI